MEEIKKRLLEKQASLVVMFADGRIQEYYNRRVEDIVSIIKEDKNAF